MTTLILIRHGESEANQRDVFAGHYNPPLTERGQEQARRTARYIRENYAVDKAYASDLQRAYVTGKCVADLFGLELTPDRNLREIDAGEWDEMTFDAISEQYPEEFAVWTGDIGRSRPTGGESVEELSRRIFSEVSKIAAENDGKTVLLAFHATPIRVLECMVKGGDLSTMKDIPWVANASVSVLTYDGGAWNYELISHDAHLGELSTRLPDNI